MDDRTPATTPGTVSAAEHERLLRDYAALRTSSRPPTRCSRPGPLGRRSRHRPDHHRRERPAALPVGGRPALPARGRRLPADQGGRAVGRVGQRTSPSIRCRWTAGHSSVGSDWTGRPSRSLTCSRTRTTAAMTSSGWRASGRPWAHPCCSTTRSSAAPASGATTVNPFDEREMAIVSAFAVQAAMAINGVKLVQQLEARRSELARKVEELEALREVGEAVSSSLDLDDVLVDDRHARGRAVRAPTAARSWSTTSRTAASWSAASTAPSPSVVDRCAPSASTSTTRSSGGPPRSAGPSRSTDLTPSTSTPTCRSWTRPAGGRVVAVPMLREERIVGVLVVRRKRTGDFAEEIARPARDLRQPVGAGAAQRPAVPRAEGAERRAGGGQPAQVRVPGQHVARAADAAQRRAGLLRGAARADVRRDQRAPGGVPAGHPRAPASTCWSCSTRSSTCPRSRPADGARVLARSTCAPVLEYAASHAARTRRRARHRPASSSSSDDIGIGRLRRAAAQAGGAQPADQRRQVHRRRRLGGGPGGATSRDDRRSRSTDTGIGVPDADRERIFESFQQGGRAAIERGGHRPRSHPVTAHRRAARWPDVAGERGRGGSTFGFSLPLSDRETGGPARRRDDDRRGDVVVIEDDRPSLDLLTAYLSGATLQVTAGGDGPSGLEAVRRVAAGGGHPRHPAARAWTAGRCSRR